ncbi:hypothetical protein ABEW34_14915 [Paenibacillus algorifonticola]|uniref:hypothetical protein n=1 Tax=Paenibacillus algorifonticola TaxID=684063 RepID=UPI003D2741EB
MEHDFEDLMDQAYDLPPGAAKLEVLEAAVRIADAEGDVENAFEARGEIVETAIFHGYPLKAIIAFSWQLGQSDQEPDNYDSSDLMWSYKWIVGNISNFPEIPMSQIQELVEDLGKRYKEHGYSRRTYLYYRSRLALSHGKLNEAKDFLEQMMKVDRDYMTDCIACEQNHIVELYAQLGEDEQALKAAEPILSGKMKCAEVPHITLPHLLSPLLRQGSSEEAQKLHTKGYRLVKGKRDLLDSVAQHIHYLTDVNPAKAVEVVELHLAFILDHENPYEVMRFNLFTARLLKKLINEGSEVKLRLPASFLTVHEDTSLPALAAHFEALALSAAKRFDARNGNDYYSNNAASLLV